MHIYSLYKFLQIYSLVLISATASTYNGYSSYARLVLDTRLVPYGDDFSVEFRTRDRGGVVLMMRLFHLDDGLIDDMVLIIIDGALQLQTYFASGEGNWSVFLCCGIKREKMKSTSTVIVAWKNTLMIEEWLNA